MSGPSGPMRVVVHDYAAYPFTAQLARSLAGRGHDVLYLHGGGIRRSRAGLETRTTDAPTLRIEAVPIKEALSPGQGSAAFARSADTARHSRSASPHTGPRSCSRFPARSTRRLQSNGHA